MINKTIKGINNYSFEGTETGEGWTIEVIDKENLLNDAITDELKQFSETIYFNDTNGRYWIFDFSINNVWFESREIDCNNMHIILNAYN
jgi:hypothetical protein